MVKQNKRRLNLKLLFAIIFLIASFFVCINIPFVKIIDFSQNAVITANEINQIQEENVFGPFVKVEFKNIEKCVNGSFSNFSSNINPEIQFKLFNLIPIKTQKIKIIKDEKVLLGGSAIGLVLKTEGVLVVGSSPVTTVDGEIDSLDNGILKIGDVILQIENETIDNVSKVSEVINKTENIGKEVTIKGLRNKKEFEAKIKPLYDIKSENYKIGVWVRDDATGIGTLTFINSDNRFGSLGHPICDSDTKSIISLKEGKIYNCSVMGINKGTCGNPGEIKGLFMQGKNPQGVVEKNNNYGVFGTINNNSNFLKNFGEIEVGSRLMVKPGKAQIRCCLDGTNIETFDVEIIKTNYQNYSSGKSMVIRVTDKELISRTGGIVQGMSGSPIIQNGKLVGAVTHVFVNDPTKGFGVYIDWMLNQ